METKKQEIMKRLGELKSVTFRGPTAMELRSPRPLLSRVQRQEDRRYKENIERQKAKLKSDLKRVESYTASVKAQESYLANTPLVLPKPKVIMGILSEEQQIASAQQQQGYLTSMQEHEDYLGMAPSISTQPIITLGQKPVLKRTRLSRGKRRMRRY